MTIKPGPLKEILTVEELELLYNATKKTIEQVPSGTEDHVDDWFYYTKQNISIEVAADSSLSETAHKIAKEVPVGYFQMFLELNFKSGPVIGNTIFSGLLDKGEDFMYYKKN